MGRALMSCEFCMGTEATPMSEATDRRADVLYAATSARGLLVTRSELRALAAEAARVGAQEALEAAHDWWFDTGHDDVADDLNDRIATYAHPDPEETR